MGLRMQYRLTPREVDVARLAADRHTAREIAGMLHITYHTARRHLEHVYAKTGVGSRAALGLLVRHLSAEDGTRGPARRAPHQSAPPVRRSSAARRRRLPASAPGAEAWTADARRSRHGRASGACYFRERPTVTSSTATTMSAAAPSMRALTASPPRPQPRSTATTGFTYA